MKIGNDIMAKKTSGLNAKDSQDFEKFVQERKKKRTREEKGQEEKVTGNRNQWLAPPQDA